MMIEMYEVRVLACDGADTPICFDGLPDDARRL